MWWRGHGEQTVMELLTKLADGLKWRGFQMFSSMFSEFEKVSEITPYLYLTSGTGAEVDNVKVIHILDILLNYRKYRKNAVFSQMPFYCEGG